MTRIDYSRQHLGYIVRDSGIPQSDWVAFASSSSDLRKQPAVEGINPFTRKPMLYRQPNFFIVVGDEPVGLVAWEEAECIGIAGIEEEVAPFIARLCEVFHARFEASAS
jgi:hypothetical protein